MPRGKKNGGGTPAATSEQVEQSAVVGSNSNERAKIIAEVTASLIKLDAQKAAIQEEITSEKARIKAIGMKMKNFNVAYALYKLETEDQNSALDDIREACEALGMGETVDWVTTVHNASTGATQKAPGYTAEQGRQAWRENKRLTDDPYPKNSPSSALWQQGFNEAQTAAALEMGGNGAGTAAH